MNSADLVPLLLYRIFHGRGPLAWFVRSLAGFVLALLIAAGYAYKNHSLTQNIIGGLLTSFLAIFLLWLRAQYKSLTPVYRFWSDFLPARRRTPVVLLIGYRQEADSRRNMGYGQAMSLPLIAQILRAMGVDWADDKQASLRYSNEDLDPHTTTFIIGGPITNRHTRDMVTRLQLPYNFDNLGDAVPVRRLTSPGNPTQYATSVEANTDCGMIVVWEREDSSPPHLHRGR